jgi:hypothetical protein
MTTTLLLLLSGALIIAGVALVWRDVRGKHRDTFVLPREPQTRAGPAPEVEISIAHRAPNAAAGDTRASAVPLPDALYAPEAAAQWATLQPVLTAAVKQVNAVLSGAGISVGAPGEPSWSMNRGYGSYRRVMVGGESVAWLRLELGPSGQLQAGVKAHKEDLAAINASSGAPAAGLNIPRASDLLSECLKPAASFAVQAVSGGNTEQWASEMAWRAIDPVVVAALQAANGALAQAGARFVPVAAPAWAPDLHRHRMTIAIEVLDKDVARMHIERIAEEVEIAVGLADARLTDLGRRQRVPAQGMTTHALAEMIASCAWPAIAHFREEQHSA